MQIKSKFTKPNSNIEIAYEDFGAGEVVLGLSGFGCDSYNFEELKKDLTNFRLILIDNRGMGESSPAENEYSLNDLAEDAILLLDYLSIDRFHIIGISMGGFIAQVLAIKYYERLLSLSLFCTTSGGSSYVTLPEMSEEGLKRFNNLSEPEKSIKAVDQLVHPSLKVYNPGRYQSIINLRRNHPADINELILQKKAVDEFLKSSISLFDIQTSTLVLTGESDRFVNPYNSSVLSAKIENSTHKIVPQTDHLFFLEKPRFVGEVTKNFLNQNQMIKPNNPIVFEGMSL